VPWLPPARVGSLALVLALLGCGLSEKRVLEGHECTPGQGPIAGAVSCQEGLRCAHFGPNRGICLRTCAATDGCRAGELCLGGLCRPACSEAMPLCQPTRPPSCGDVACFTSPDTFRACCRMGDARGCLFPYECGELGGQLPAAADGGTP
jgi:hypothetical protein